LHLKSMYHKTKRGIKDIIYHEQGQGLVEYGLILTFIALVVISALAFLGEEVQSMFQEITGFFQ